MKQINPNHNTSVISKRNTESSSKQNLVKSLTSHCDLPEHNEEFSTYIFVYNETANLKKIIRSIKRERNSARVLLAVAMEEANMIIFQMNRAAYLQVYHKK